VKTAPRLDAAGHRALTVCGAALAAVWLALRVPHFAVRYAFGWDSSQFARALFEFNIEKHQPHPPGYPLWVLASRLLMPLFGQPYTPQVMLALLFTLGALPPFWWLARRMFGPAGALAATAALAFSPLTSLYASVPLTYAADLFASCWTGWLAFRIWRGESRYVVPAWVLLAVAAGFRQSGAVWLVPLLAIASVRAWRKKPAPVLWGLGLASAALLAWYLPAAAMMGGLRKLMFMTRMQARGSFRATSVLYGATPVQHLQMLVGLVMCLGTALGVAVLVAAFWRWRARGIAPGPATPAEWPAAALWLWLAPNLLVTSLLHFGAPGYLLLSIPPMVLLAFTAAARGLNTVAATPNPRLRAWLWTAAAVAAVSLVVSYFPYRVLFFWRPALGFTVERTTPRLPLVIESSQRELARILPSLPAGAAFVCALNRPDAPNIRTVTFDFPGRDWIAPGEVGLRVSRARGGEVKLKRLPYERPLVWVFPPEGPAGPLERAVPLGTKQIAVNEVFSLWVTPAAAAAVSGAE